MQQLYSITAKFVKTQQKQSQLQKLIAATSIYYIDDDNIQNMNV